MVASTVLLLTQKPFAASARGQVDAAASAANLAPVALENYGAESDAMAKIAAVCPAALIVRSDPITPSVLTAAKAAGVKLIVRAGAGVDTIDLDAATKEGIVVMNTPGANANAVAELVVGLLIRKKRNGYDGSPGTELRGKTVGLYGFGAVARALGAVLKGGFGVNIVAFDPFVPADAMVDWGARAADSVQDLFACDVVSLHVPATKETKKSIGQALASLLPRNGVLVNTARGDIIDEPGLRAVLASRPDIAYLSDVQPIDTPSSEWKATYGEQVYFTPKKMGAQTEEANTNAGVAACAQIAGWLNNREGERFVVNKDVLKK